MTEILTPWHDGEEDGEEGVWVEMVDPQRVMLEEIADSRMTRDDVATSYAFGLRQGGVDWATVNRAIIERWSRGGLRYIKERAWKRARGNG